MNEYYLALKEKYDAQQLYSNQMSKCYIALKKRYHTHLLVHFILIDPQILELLLSVQHYLPQILELLLLVQHYSIPKYESSNGTLFRIYRMPMYLSTP